MSLQRSLNIYESVQKNPKWKIISEWIWSKWDTCLTKMLVKILLWMKTRNLMNKVTQMYHKKELSNFQRRYLKFSHSFPKQTFFPVLCPFPLTTVTIWPSGIFVTIWPSGVSYWFSEIFSNIISLLKSLLKFDKTSQ